MKDYCWALRAGLLGFGLCLYYGHVGFIPMDHSIVFDGAWRVLSGQIPYKDFTTPCGITPILMQAVLFKLLGVSWFVYCLHAALLNGLFCVLVYVLLRLFKAPCWLAFFYAGLSAFVYYTPYGVPFLEHHAFFGMMLALVLAVWSHQSETLRVKYWCWFCIPIVLALAYLSKQIPTILGVPVFLYFWLQDWRRVWLSSILGKLVVYASLALVIAYFHLDMGLIQYYFLHLPASTGSARYLWLLEKWEFVQWNMATMYFVQGLMALLGCWALGHYIPRLKPLSQWVPRHVFWFSGLIMAMLGMVGINPTHLPAGYRLFLMGMALNALGGLILYEVVRRGLNPCSAEVSHLSLTRRLPMHQLALILGEALILICFVFTSLTHNRYDYGLAFIFSGLGLVHLYLLTLFQYERWPLHLFNKGFTLSAATGVSVLLMSFAVSDVGQFHVRANLTRSYALFSTQPLTPEKDRRLPVPLSYLVWDISPFINNKICDKPGRQCAYHAHDILAITQFFQTHPGNFFLLGDTTVLYALTHRPSLNPVLWLHPGLTMPWPRTPQFSIYETRLLQNLRNHHVQYIVTEGEHTWTKLTLNDFPQLNQMIQKQGSPPLSLGLFTIYPVSLTPMDDPLLFK